MDQGIPRPALPSSPPCIDPRLLMRSPSQPAGSNMDSTAFRTLTENMAFLREFENGYQRVRHHLQVELGDSTNAPTVSTTAPVAEMSSTPRSGLSDLSALQIAAILVREREQFDEQRRRNEQLAIMEGAHHRAAQTAAEKAARLAADEEAARVAHAKYLENMRITNRARHNKKLVRAAWEKQSKGLMKEAQVVGSLEMEAMAEATKETRMQLEMLDREMEERMRLQRASEGDEAMDMDIDMDMDLDMVLNMNREFRSNGN